MTKKILFILHLPPPVHGAAMVGKYIQESKAINKSFECDYINLSTSKELNEIGKGGLSKITSIASLQWKVWKILRRKSFDLCYMTLTAQGAGFYKDLLIVSILKLFGIKIVYHFHNKGIAIAQKNKLSDLLYQFVFKGTQSILLSRFLYPDVKRYVKKEDVYYCANGIPKIPGADHLSRLSKNKEHPFCILFLSNMMEEKGVWVLLEACKLLKEGGIIFECHFIGAWSDISEVDFRSKVEIYQLSSFVFAHGKKYNEEKNSFFLKADVFVFPTYYHNEAFSLVILEAMQAGLPVISTAEGGIADMVIEGVTGSLVPKRNPQALANSIKVLYDQPSLCLKLGMEGRKKYLELFTLETFEKNMLEILATITTESKY
jgi:glycosyltransferase involved in cell wall biosynthesis